MTIKDLKPCPFCGATEADGYVHTQLLYNPWAEDEDNSETWEVMCENCGGEIMEFKTETEAAQAWNRRANDATN